VLKGQTSGEQPLLEFLAQAYELKALADYGTGADAVITSATAKAAVAASILFVERVAELLADV
jgi:hypothetical protein